PQPAVASVGLRPTVNALQRPLLEVHLLDYDGDLYGQSMTLEFVSRLRDTRRFGSVDELREQLRRDVAQTIEAVSHD
ncbi:MAG: bifunctional riboflavin kinase/FAD synthetase, partial [Planctomycetia bacterium]|nr:bifunctional riboflavin kinase/FAD synthetase [Planctomycetia bacterium]